ncbi:MAG: hypothetical protein A2855_02235 [Candidatus Liptonbacteria bacterium RIFCSPHIGHO2_01_FULL_57_28]|uniref:Nudix hydrolase domain-containing protein n=1 Tax=Candidatus Liptonbacteria bacterium RIFCSPHIGHO2_01_FULL_57_28 TaxID=1798647 RepID=A0A1G2CAR2_9BACT|nr:MAG: hypothetical protein A2855_02235 [Candidatus Liptonbacteria bacterium RIFCSPHIGHO2_01_FULL_57_28]
MDRVYDLVDRRDKVIRRGTKEAAKASRLFTRSVHIILENRSGKIMLCTRPMTKKSYPGMMTSSAGGHVERGETYEKAARRELFEELGLKLRLKDAGRFDVVNRRERAIHRLFVGKLKKESFLLDVGEVSAYKFLNPETIAKDIKKHPRRYAAPFHGAFRKYLEHKKLYNTLNV